MFYGTNTDRFIVNNENLLDLETKEKLDKLLMINYSEDTLSLIPKCDCGELSGNFYIGETCRHCNTVVKSMLENNLSFLLWLEKPIGVENFISPIVLSMLLKRYKTSRPRVHVVEYLIKPNMRIPQRTATRHVEQLDKLDALLDAAGIKRGYNSFITNFFQIIEILETHFSKKSKAEKENFKSWLYSNRRVLFSNYLPFPNKSIFVIDSNELGSYIDRTLLLPLNSLRRVTGIDLRDQTLAAKQLKVAKSLIELADFYSKYMADSFFKKPGLVRKHINSTRSHFTARAVITSLPGQHQYDEVWLPWTLACGLFREHIIKGLQLHGYSYKEAISHYMLHLTTYSEVIGNIFNTILLESGDGVKALLNRNPSLHRGSLQTIRITKVKTNPDDNTIGMSYLIAPAFNADYDGDMLNLTLVLTEKATKELVNFEPHLNILGLTGPNEFTNTIQFPKTITATLTNWFNDGIESL